MKERGSLSAVARWKPSRQQAEKGTSPEERRRLYKAAYTATWARLKYISDQEFRERGRQACKRYADRKRASRVTPGGTYGRLRPRRQVAKKPAIPLTVVAERHGVLASIVVGVRRAIRAIKRLGRPR